MTAAPLTATPGPWPRHAVLLHWLTFALVVLAYSSIELRSLFDRGSLPRELFKLSHMMIGSLLFLVTLLRVGLKVLVPSRRPALPGLGEWLARRLHMILLLFLVAMPLLGVLSMSADGSRLPVLGEPFPSPVRLSEDLADEAEDLHESLGVLGYYLIGAHALAGLAHHYLLRDNRLRAMLGRAPR